jgi:hypothetical protein
MKSVSKYITLILTIFCASIFNIVAQEYSYLYIEGDKETPFYIKMEGQMMPRLAQNYAVLSNLDAGVTNIEILFQQNKYPPAKFAIKIPKNASRGLVLRRVDSDFALYDLQTGHYIFAGNKPQDDNIDKLEARAYTQEQAALKQRQELIKQSKENKVVKAETPSKVVDETLPSFQPGKSNMEAQNSKKPSKAKEDKVKKEEKLKVEHVKIEKAKEAKVVETEKSKPVKTSVLNEPTQAPNLPKSDKQSKYLNNVLINGEESDWDINESDSSVPPNTDCKMAMSEVEFDAFFNKLKDREEEAKIKFLSKNKKLCFTTEQVSIIGRSIKSTSGRMQVLKQLYAQTFDPQNYHLLEHLFSTEYLKKKFKDSINN